MRLIDADALWMDVIHRIDYCDDILEMIEAMPTVEPEQKWIPCSERLPDEKINPNTQDYDWVLCSTTFDDVRAYNFGRGRFLHGCGDVTQYVTAWMPLPKPYQEEGENDGSD